MNPLKKQQKTWTPICGKSSIIAKNITWKSHLKHNQYFLVVPQRVQNRFSQKKKMTEYISELKYLASIFEKKKKKKDCLFKITHSK